MLASGVARRQRAGFFERCMGSSRNSAGLDGPTPWPWHSQPPLLLRSGLKARRARTSWSGLSDAPVLALAHRTAFLAGERRGRVGCQRMG